MYYDNLSVVIPFRAKCSEREKIFKWVCKRTQLILPGAEVIVGSDSRNTSEFFNKSIAINDAVKKATRNIILILDSDAFIDSIAFEKAYELAKSNSMVMVSNEIKYLNKEFSKKLIQLQPDIKVTDIYDLDQEVLYKGGSVSVALLVHRDKFIEMNGFDERFIGWGGEDDAFYCAYSTLFGESVTTDCPGYHIHHPRANQENLDNQSNTLAEENKNASADNSTHYEDNVRLAKEYVSFRGNYGEMKKYISGNSINRSNGNNKRMKIAHVAPYGPNSCGIYEAARDMMKADVSAGHEVYFVDKGNTVEGKTVFQPIGTLDDRGGFKLVTSDPKTIDNVDVIIAHTMPHNEWLARNQVPIIFVVHGRPLYSFRLENSSDDARSYTYINDISHFPRVKKMLYFWPEFTPYWSTFPQEKVLALDFPIIDQVRFSPEGEKHVIGEVHKGEYNILICDSWREDVDMFEIFNGALQAARELKNVKFHLYATESKNGNVNLCWDLLIKEMRKLNAMGELCGRMSDMEKVYRSMDAVLTPHRIVVRTIGEAQSCGVPVIADEKCKVAQFGCDPHSAYSVADAIKKFVNSDKKENIKNALESSKNFSPDKYSQQMEKVYKELSTSKE